ncbi:MAG: TetR/AcrR family transcriptional regulator [Rhodobacteraceae bacterium]|nr:TetR/AcrR family transcriptional regulator [Paracoccaceae bacterium]
MPRGIACDHDRKRAALRKGAANYFATHGFDRASMTGAAKHCGVSKALIYHYYDGKEALLFDILDTHLSELVDVVGGACPQRLDALIPAILTAYEDADAEHKLQLEALAALPPEMQAPLIALQRQLVADMSAALAIERPDVAPDTLRALTMTVFGILNWFYMWHRPGKGLDRDAYAALAARFVRGGLTAI